MGRAVPPATAAWVCAVGERNSAELSPEAVRGEVARGAGGRDDCLRTASREVSAERRRRRVSSYDRGESHGIR